MNPVLKDLLKLLQDTSSCVRCNDSKQVQVHRLILSARSPVFKAMMECDMKENRNGEVELHCSEEIASALVHYIYTGELKEEVTGEIITELLKLGHEYQINDLVEDCSDKLEITEANVLQLGAFAEMFDAQTLLKKCAKFISENKRVLDKDVWEKQLEDSPKFVMSIVKSLTRKEDSSTGKDVAISRFSGAPV